MRKPLHNTKKGFGIALTLGFIVLLMLPAFTSLAQGPGDPGGDPDAGIPVDGGISALLIAGVGYGVAKYRKHLKKASNNQQPE